MSFLKWEKKCIKTWSPKKMFIFHCWTFSFIFISNNIFCDKYCSNFFRCIELSSCQIFMKCKLRVIEKRIFNASSKENVNLYAVVRFIFTYSILKIFLLSIINVNNMAINFCSIHFKILVVPTFYFLIIYWKLR